MDRPYECSVCNRSFKLKQFLQRHMTVHTDERKFECVDCGKSYKYSKGLNRHRHQVHNYPKGSQQTRPKERCWDWRLFIATDEARYSLDSIFETPACPHNESS